MRIVSYVDSGGAQKAGISTEAGVLPLPCKLEKVVERSLK